MPVVVRFICYNRIIKTNKCSENDCHMEKISKINRSFSRRVGVLKCGENERSEKKTEKRKNSVKKSV